MLHQIGHGRFEKADATSMNVGVDGSSILIGSWTLGVRGKGKMGDRGTTAGRSVFFSETITFNFFSTSLSSQLQSINFPHLHSSRSFFDTIYSKCRPDHRQPQQVPSALMR